MCETPPLGKTRFTEFLVRHNALDEGGFGEWILYPGMLFNARDKWWGDGGKRQQPHEGLDLCLYRDQQGQTHLFDEGTKIPVMYDGVVAKIVDDFLGKSIIVDHGVPDGHDSRFFTIYGHTNPHADLEVGKSLTQGDVIATLADSSKTEAGLVPHLHISLGLIPKATPYDRLDWQMISTTSMVTLLDPLSAMDCRYVVAEDALALR